MKLIRNKGGNVTIITRFFIYNFPSIYTISCKNILKILQLKVILEKLRIVNEFSTFYYYVQEFELFFIRYSLLVNYINFR
jgi:hypothetical protein